MHSSGSTSIPVSTEAWLKNSSALPPDRELWSVGTPSGFRGSRTVFRVVGVLSIVGGTALVCLSLRGVFIELPGPLFARWASGKVVHLSDTRLTGIETLTLTAAAESNRFRGIPTMYRIILVCEGFLRVWCVCSTGIAEEFTYRAVAQGCIVCLDGSTLVLQLTTIRFEWPRST